MLTYEFKHLLALSQEKSTIMLTTKEPKIFKPCKGIENKVFISREEAAFLFSIPRTTFDELRNQGIISHIKLGRRVCFNRLKLENELISHYEIPATVLKKI